MNKHITEGIIDQYDKHKTGAQRSADCKGYNYWLISPIALEEVALAANYINLEGVDASQCINHSLTFKYGFLRGDGIHHITFSALCVMHAIQKIESEEKINYNRENKIIKTFPKDWRNGECRYDLIPFHGLEALAKRMHLGAMNYGIMNWENGFPISDLQDHSIRHLKKYQNGDQSDDHLGAALWGDFATIHSYYKWPELNKLLRGPNCTLTEEHRKYHESFKR